jgi:SAM-dependent methyltransferase
VTKSPRPAQHLAGSLAVTARVTVETPLRVYAKALRRARTGQGTPLELVSIAGEVVGRVDAALWTLDQRAGDESMLRHCRGATLDVGCGPGRLTAALHSRGEPALGVDICPEAIRQTRRRGAPAVWADVFDPLPMEGRWQRILLADGNIGIGGDPSRLLRRCASLLDRQGAVVAEVHPPGAASWAGRIALHDGERHSTPFPWARVSLGDVARLASGTPLRVADEWTEAGRWFVRLERSARRLLDQ